MRRLILLISVVLFSATTLAAKDWRGILPMHSTREHVEKLLGRPAQENEWRSIYHLDEGEIYIVFGEVEMLKKHGCQTVAPGTVMMIQVAPKEMLLSSLNLDERRFRKFNPSTPIEHGLEAFVNEDEGFAVRVSGQNVQQMVFTASASDRSRCSGNYVNLDDSVRVFACALPTQFDEHGDIDFEDEMARLDNFAIQLQNSEAEYGHVIVYAGQVSTLGEARLRADRIHQYLVGVKGVNPARLKVIDGGFMVDFTVTFWILGEGQEPPTPAITLDPSDVTIVSEKKRRSRNRNR